MITLQEVANYATRAAGRTFYVQCLGGNVWGAVDYTGRTITIDDGVTTALGDVVDVLVCQDGGEVFAGTITSAAEVGPLVGLPTAEEEWTDASSHPSYWRE